jgi:hypothetical protein
MMSVKLALDIGIVRLCAALEVGGLANVRTSSWIGITRCDCLLLGPQGDAQHRVQEREVDR